MGTCTCQSNPLADLDSPRVANDAVSGDGYVYASFAMTCAVATAALVTGAAFAYRQWRAHSSAEIEL